MLNIQVAESTRRANLLTVSNAIIPAAGNDVTTVVIPTLRVLVVKRFTSDETGEFLAPVCAAVEKASVKPANDNNSVAKTVRPARARKAV